MSFYLLSTPVGRAVPDICLSACYLPLLVELSVKHFLSKLSSSQAICSRTPFGLGFPHKKIVCFVKNEKVNNFPLLSGSRLAYLFRKHNKTSSINYYRMIDLTIVLNSFSFYIPDQPSLSNPLLLLFLPLHSFSF